jgi:CRISPR-associated protein Csm3
MTQLNKKIIIEGTIKTLTGLHIGGTNSAMGIGGPDSMVVRNPLDNKPYIPGSSLKGKLRAMLDIADGTIEEVRMGQVKNGTSQDPESASASLFGTARNDDRQRPSAVIVRDCELKGTDEELDKLFKNTDLPFSESKTEVVIDRITAKAMPRQLERVPAGAEFKMNLVVNIFDDNEQKEQLTNLARAMRLLMDDYLGGNGSRGYGQIEIVPEKVSERSIGFYIGTEKENDITETFKNYLNNGN